jgi:hypothetical protein
LMRALIYSYPQTVLPQDTNLFRTPQLTALGGVQSGDMFGETGAALCFRFELARRIKGNPRHRLEQCRHRFFAQEQ